MRLLRPLAEQGNAVAQYSLGVMYFGGQGVPQDDDKALAWWRKAGKQGNALAQGNLGKMYAMGRGVPQDYAQALAWYGKSADQGNANADSDLGNLYADGLGVPPPPPLAQSGSLATEPSSTSCMCSTPLNSHIVDIFVNVARLPE
jgi:uncharacterized protein